MYVAEVMRTLGFAKLTNIQIQRMKTCPCREYFKSFGI